MSFVQDFSTKAEAVQPKLKYFYIYIQKAYFLLNSYAPWLYELVMSMIHD